MMADVDYVQLLEKLLRDDSHSKSEDKLTTYASDETFATFMREHPMLFIYCCASNGDVDECIRLLATMSNFCNFQTTKPSSEEIYEMVEYVTVESRSKSILKVIFEAEQKYLHIVKAVPVLFFKASVDKGRFDIDQLSEMLRVRNRVESKKMSQHDASVSVGTLLVDKFVKPHLN